MKLTIGHEFYRYYDGHPHVRLSTKCATFETSWRILKSIWIFILGDIYKLFNQLLNQTLICTIQYSKMPRAFLIKNKKQQANGNGPNQDQLTDTDAREASLDERRSGTPTQEEERLEGEEGGRNPEHLEKTREKDTYSERANIFMISNLKIPHQAGNNQRPPPLIELQRLPYRFSPMMISPEREPRRGDSPASDLPEKGYTGREFPPVRRMSSPPVDPISIYPSPSPSSEGWFCFNINVKTFFQENNTFI